MKASVVMTTYNGIKFLPEMLESLRNQTREIDELLIYDDGSTDDTVAYVSEYISKYQLAKWKIFVNEKNLGWEKNFIQGLEHATGDILFPCDQDDIWHLDKIEKMTAAFENNKEIWLLVSNYHAFSTEETDKIVVNRPIHAESNDIVSRIAFDEKYHIILRPGCTMAFRKEMLQILNEVWESGSPHDATLWTAGALLRKLYWYNETLIEYRRHSNNTSNTLAHSFKYKLDDCTRTRRINNWYLNSQYHDQNLDSTIEGCQTWCDYRLKLLADKKLIYWFKLFRYRKYHLSLKRCIGDLYYFTKKVP